MSDPLSASRLGDLPDAGYATKRQRETSDAIMFFMRDVERNRVLLLSIVVDGIDQWRKVGARAWKGLLIDRDLLDSIYRGFPVGALLFWQQAGVNPAEQLLILIGQAEQAKRAAWDKRASTKRASDAGIRAAVKDARKEQMRLANRKTFS